MGTYRTGVVTNFPIVGGPAYNTFHFRTEDGIDVPVELQRATDALEDAYANLRGQNPSSVQWVHDGRWVEISDSSIVQTTGWSAQGTASGTFDWLPGMSTICVGWTTASAARSGKGRTFISPWGENSNSNGVPTATAVNAVRAFATALVTASGVGFGAFAVHSPTFNLTRDIVGANVRPVWASLRSRRD